MAPERYWRPSTERDKLRSRLFDQGWKALVALGATEECYVCPLCAMAFGFQAVVQKYLTLEHVPPKSIGGREIVLTCKKCNNSAGSGADAALAEAHRVGKAVRAIFNRSVPLEEPVPVKLSTENYSINAQVSKKFNGLNFEASSRYNNPIAIDGFNSEMKSFNAGDSFRLVLTGRFKSSQLARAYTKSAFLLAFAKLGYSFALSDGSAWVRDYLCEKAAGDVSLLIKVNENMPSGIHLVHRHPVIVVALGDFRIALPSPDFSGSQADFISVIESMRIVQVDCYDMPRHIEALLDHKGRGSFHIVP